jgi:hypothetical protein
VAGAGLAAGPDLAGAFVAGAGLAAGPDFAGAFVAGAGLAAGPDLAGAFVAGAGLAAGPDFAGAFGIWCLLIWRNSDLSILCHIALDGVAKHRTIPLRAPTVRFSGARAQHTALRARRYQLIMEGETPTILLMGVSLALLIADGTLQYLRWSPARAGSAAASAWLACAMSARTSAR